MTPERKDRLLQRRARLIEHASGKHGEVAPDRAHEYAIELKKIEGELAGEIDSPTGQVVEVPVGNLSAKPTV
jgi:hypothetical protein